jgi:hypothetical protein
MRYVAFLASLTAVAGFALGLVGCNSSTSPAPAQHSAAGSPSDSAADHDHAGHDQGEHPTAGPHGGHLVELGHEEYHAEWLLDEVTHTVTFYVLDATGKKEVPIESPELTLQLLRDGQFAKYVLKAVADPEDRPGTASRFEIVDADLCDVLGHEEDIVGRVQVTVDGKPYTGTIEHHDHEGHDHD